VEGSLLVPPPGPGTEGGARGERREKERDPILLGTAFRLRAPGLGFNRAPSSILLSHTICIVNGRCLVFAFGVSVQRALFFPPDSGALVSFFAFERFSPNRRREPRTPQTIFGEESVLLQPCSSCIPG
jgi:hypothetical protein